MKTLTRKPVRSRLANHIRAYCKSKGIRCSSKRIQVANCLKKANKYVDADELLMIMRKEQIRISFPYIYQCLNWLEEIQFVSRQMGTDKRQKFCISPTLPELVTRQSVA